MVPSPRSRCRTCGVAGHGPRAAILFATHPLNGATSQEACTERPAGRGRRAWTAYSCRVHLYEVETIVADEGKMAGPVSMAGSIAANLHEGSRSEYLAQFVFSSFGTAIPVPHQEELRAGHILHAARARRAAGLATAYYSVQVKSTMTPWVFSSPESVRWIIEHPLPIFLCIVHKTEARNSRLSHDPALRRLGPAEASQSLGVDPRN